MSQHIENIKSLLKQLDNNFYDTIDSGLIQHPELCSFASNMETIITSIKHSLEQINSSSPPHQIQIPINIDYAQLQSLSTSNKLN